MRVFLIVLLITSLLPSYLTPGPLNQVMPWLASNAVTRLGSVNTHLAPLLEATRPGQLPVQLGAKRKMQWAYMSDWQQR